MCCACQSEPNWLYLPESGHRRLPDKFRKILHVSACVWKGGSGARPQAGADAYLYVQLCANVCMCDSELEDRNLCTHAKLCVCMCVQPHAQVVLRGLDGAGAKVEGIGG